MIGGPLAMPAAKTVVLQRFSLWKTFCENVFTT